MLRFDIAPVCANAYRLQAAMSFTIAALYLFTPYRWVAVLLVLGGFLRGFVSPHKCLSYRLFAAVTRRLGLARTQNAGSKMFADKVAFVAGAVMVGSWLLGSEIGMVPATAILIFALLDLVTGFCAACWAYGLWYRIRAS
ncbi:MAG TPA: DUF4395 family protein [Azonexus sp.]